MSATRVVIVDDTPDLRDLLALALTRGGLSVVGEAGDGREGIETVRRERPDLVLLDLSMPVMDGLTALPRIRALTPRGKVVVLSGFDSGQMAERAMSLGADGYLQKGMPLTKILEYVRHVVDDEPDQDVVPPRAPVPPRVATAVHEVGWAEEALLLAPFGVIEVADEPTLAVLHANPVAARLLSDRAAVGVPLAAASPELARQVASHRPEARAVFEVQLDGDLVRVASRRASGSIVVYLDPSGHAVTLLRRAIATTAHEIRGPVTVLAGVAESVELLSDRMDEVQRARLMASVARQARLLDHITSDLLTAAQISRGTLSVRTRAVDAAAVVDSVVTDRFVVAVHRWDDRRVLADAVRLEQMLSNLLSNAVKYGRPPFDVTIRPDPEHPDLVCIDVTDAGHGVPPGFVDDLFGEFTRVADNVAAGTGLGLYVVRTLAEAQGGSVSYSPVVGGGARFTVRLPIAPSWAVPGNR